MFLLKTLWKLKTLWNFYIVEFLVALHRMTALTFLHLPNVLATARRFLSSGTFSVSPKISLPHLARLFVVAPLSTVVALLSCIAIPLETQVRLDIILEEGSSVDDYAQLPSVVAQRCTKSEDLSFPGPTIRSLVVDSSDLFILAVSERSGHVALSYPYLLWDCDLPFVMIVRRELWMVNNDRNRIFNGVCCAIPSTHIQTLHVIHPPFSPNFWRKLLDHLPGLRYMKLSNSRIMPDLVSLLALPADEPLVTPERHGTSDHDRTRNHKFVPALEALELCRIGFRQSTVDEDCDPQQSLLDTLSTRKVRLTINDPLLL